MQEYSKGLPFPSPGVSSQPRDRTLVSCIAGRFFTAEPSRKSLVHPRKLQRPSLKVDRHTVPNLLQIPFVTLSELVGPLENVNSKPFFTNDRPRTARPLPFVSQCCSHPDPHPHAYCVPLTHPIQASTVSRRRALVTRG